MNKKMRVFALCFLSILFSISIVSAVGYDWDNFGSSLTYVTQSSDTNVYAELSNGYNFTTIGNGNIYQTLITGLTNESKNYLTFQQSNGYLVVRNESILLDVIYMGGYPMGQHASVDWDNDSIKEIATMILYNSTNWAFQIYELNSTEKLNNIYTFNFTYPINSGMTGLKCAEGECWTILHNYNAGYFWAGFFINSTGYTSFAFLNGTTYAMTYIPYEPSSKLDWDNDGYDEYLAYTHGSIAIYNRSEIAVTTPELLILTNGTKVARFFNPNGTYMLAVLDYDFKYLKIYNHDGSIVYQHQNPLSAPAGMCVADYDGDFYDELMTADWNYANSGTNYSVFDGDASLIYRKNQSISGTQTYNLMCAKMDGANTYDFIVSAIDNYGGWGIVNIFSPAKNESVFYYDKMIPMHSPIFCSAGDTNIDGFLEAVCSEYDYNGETILIYATNTTNFTANTNPIINSVIFNPATSINRGETIYATINASDNESNTIYYSARCNSTANFSIDNTSSTISCYYANAGTFTMTLRVKDAFHSWYNTYSQTIIVYSQNMTQVEGGIALPMDLVNPDNINQGLLPEIYYGILAFASGSYLPLFVIIFAIFVVLIILALFGIVKRIAQKVFE